MLTTIALKRLQVWPLRSDQQDSQQTNALVFELGQLGYKIANIEQFTSTTREEFIEVITTLKQMRGDDEVIRSLRSCIKIS